MFNIDRLFWALRKIRLPIDSNALVLDVGSGGNPFPRSDVLLDRLTGDDHRNGESMMIDRACVLGDAGRMPFKDNAFDFANATVEGANAAYTSGSSSITIGSPSVGDIFIVKLRGGSSYAVIEITGNDASDNTCNLATGNTGKLTFSYKLEA